MGFSPQKICQIKQNYQLLGCAFLSVNNMKPKLYETIHTQQYETVKFLDVNIQLVFLISDLAMDS